ncbi:putative protein kinase [Leptomonas pyrrhocoris]|uniref:Protein kinase domain-containing protein n=1 Tax=Leptomonas pyrrhocoris TaxID=157538 RepID=A0A0N0DTB8_LEPPY|nr:putative protein kinase [Leptomonas pyrrhocoris]KPA77268.1 putative protein kinase [Leptomonas pyrrhocoris]|eukprot:XP_015655707.1 putative protein kinase [Leptomonas pyrrhocoris]
MSDTTPIYMVNVPVGPGGGASGGEGQAVSGYSHWRGGGGVSSGNSGGGGGGYHPDHQRRRNGGGGYSGYGDLFQSPRQQQQQPQQHLSPRSQHGRRRGGNGGGGGSLGNTDRGMHSRIPSSSSGQDLPPMPPVDSSSGTHVEAETMHGAFDLSSLSPPHATHNSSAMTAAAVAAGVNFSVSNTAATAAVAPLPYALSGSSARRGSAAAAAAAASGGGATTSRISGVEPPFAQHSSSSSSGLAGGELRGDRSAGVTISPPPLSLSAQQQQQQQQQPQMSSAGVSRSGVSTSSTTTNANSGAAAGGGGVTRYTRLRGEERPTVALSQNIMSVYQTINEIFYQERQKLLAAPAKYVTRKYEDASGHYVPCEGEVIADRYVFKELIGQGSFGKVLHCIDRKYNEPVAVKIIRSGPYFESQGWFEAQVVAHLNNDVSLQNLVVQLRKVFLWKGHMVLVFEPLSFSLYKLITLTKHNGVSLDLTRKFAYQMVKVLLVLEQHQPPIIHCDLKPENVLLRDPSRSGVRVIDFGSACYQQQTTWRLPPAQVPLPASSPSASAGPPWDCVGERRSGGGTGTTTTTTAAAVVSSSSAASSPRAAATSSVAKASAGGGGETATGETATGPPLQQQTTAVAATGTTAPTSTTANATDIFFPAATITAAGANADVEVVMPKYIQSRYYRSPEVILELGYTTAIDRWSLGCFLTEMHTGCPLFQGNNETDMVAYFTMVLGALPDYMIAASPKRTRLYHTCPIVDNNNNGGGGGGGGGEGTSSPPALGGSSSAAGTAQALSLQPEQQKQQQQRAASPLLAFTTSPSPILTPFTDAPGHAPGSPFFLRAPQVEDTESATANAVRAAGPGTPLEKVLGVHTGGPRGCRAGQRGHDAAAYETFCDFIEKLLQYDPRQRMSCAQAIQHPFLEPIRVLEARAAAAAVAEADATATPSRTGTGAAAEGDEGSATTASVATTTTAAVAPDKSSDAFNA